MIFSLSVLLEQSETLNEFQLEGPEFRVSDLLRSSRGSRMFLWIFIAVGELHLSNS